MSIEIAKKMYARFKKSRARMMLYRSQFRWNFCSPSKPNPELWFWRYVQEIPSGSKGSYWELKYDSWSNGCWRVYSDDRRLKKGWSRLKLRKECATFEDAIRYAEDNIRKLIERKP